MPTLTLPEPFDFVRSTERYRAFGPDLANLWHEGGVHRVFDGREVRIEAASGGVDVEPFEPRVHHYLGGPFDLDGFYAFAESDPVLARIVRELRGLRPPLNPDPYETLVTSITAQQVSLRSAFAVRNRLIERFGVRAGHAWAFPTEERMASADESELTEIGFSRRKAEYVVGVARAAVDWDELATLARRRAQGAARRAARARRVDRRLVHGPAPRTTARVAGRRPGARQGTRRVLLRRCAAVDRRDARVRRALRARSRT